MSQRLAARRRFFPPADRRGCLASRASSLVQVLVVGLAAVAAGPVSGQEILRPIEATASAPRPVVLPTTIRVGLATDVESYELPCCREQWVLRAEGVASALRVPQNGALEIRPSPGSVDVAVYRLQVAALKDEVQAYQLADRLAAATGQEGNVVFDAAIDLYRVRVGRYASRPEAERASRQLEAIDITGSWIVSEGGEVVDPAFELVQGEKRRRLEGRWLLVRGSSESFVYSSHRYRGSLLLFLNSRGKINVVNRLSLDDYLRGVLPREMGPELYPSVEALKALAVAARSYVLRNLGEFDEEGYDICATPRCQVYGGMDAEHPTTDRAIAETEAQLLMWHDEPADTLYSASCGGHTENVEVVFPLKSEPYLKGVTCLERGSETLAGGASPADLERFLGALDPTTERYSAHFLRTVEGGVKVRIGGRHERFALRDDFVTARSSANGYRNEALLLWAGDPLELYVERGEVVAVVAPAWSRGTFQASRNSWSRFRSDAQLARMVAERYPGFRLRDLEVTERGGSGRVARLRLTASDGGELEIEGLAIRWTLDLPETLFTLERQSRSGSRGWLFRGHGHGHGVGLCQKGAHAMAQAGHGYREILDHFYTGLELRQVPPQALAASASLARPQTSAHD